MKNIIIILKKMKKKSMNKMIKSKIQKFQQNLLEIKNNKN